MTSFASRTQRSQSLGFAENQAALRLRSSGAVAPVSAGLGRALVTSCCWSTRDARPASATRPSRRLSATTRKPMRRSCARAGSRAPTGSGTSGPVRAAGPRWAGVVHAGPAVPLRGRELPVAAGFRRPHPWRLRLFASVLGWDLSTNAAVTSSSAASTVAFRPEAAPPTTRLLSRSEG